MDILTHTLSGVAVGTVASSFSKSGFKGLLTISFISGLGGALPDLDAISLWSGFDATIGDFFNLPTSGRNIYSGKYWYSHHAFMHSISAAIIIAFVMATLHYGISSRSKQFTNIGFRENLLKIRIPLLGFILGFLMHLIEDMPTPSSAWGGVNLLWPSKTYIGGTGDIWWWNNYDIFLIVVGVISFNLLLFLIRRWVKFNLKVLTIGIFLLGFSLAVTQIKTRAFDFAYKGNTTQYQKFEQQSKTQQRKILGNTLFKLMEGFDNKLRFYF
ncbi:metal-dependent hydrolase [Algivirga pacifica]|uniref:Metal-dependent hydrolase n=1 Tax=Algivirga pacifica TaxID=1162670 RepID=A0ABP9CXV0_9BACT